MSKQLIELLQVLPDSKSYQGNKDLASIIINDIKLDSRAVTTGDLFLAYQGTHLDGKNFIQQAFANGAVAVLSDEPYQHYQNYQNYQTYGQKTTGLVLYIKNLSQYISALAAAFYNNPSAKQNLYVITGTNGKTTCSYLLAQLLYLLNNKQETGLISTIGYGNIGNILATGVFKPLAMTTPEPIMLQKILHEYEADSIQNVCMEGSSHALSQHRLAAVNIKTAVFTNLTHDHLDYHKDIEDYFLAKRKLFYFASVQHTVINIDDRYGKRLVAELLEDKKTKPIIYSMDKNNIESFKQSNLSYVYCKHVVFSEGEIKTDLVVEIYDHLKKQSVDLNLSYQPLGDFNIYNLLAVIGCAYANDYKLSDLQECVSLLKSAPGRMESFYNQDKKITLVVDYAHTPDALLQVLQTLKEYIKNNKLTSKLWCIFGCGGDRDSSKRPVMGKVAAEYSDLVIITDDNPRTESADNIIKDIIAGIEDKNKIYQVINSRTEAINAAINAASINDVILIAGKGHEDYQIYGNNKTNYNERQYVAQLVKK